MGNGVMVSTEQELLVITEHVASCRPSLALFFVHPHPSRMNIIRYFSYLGKTLKLFDLQVQIHL